MATRSVGTLDWAMQVADSVHNKSSARYRSFSIARFNVNTPRLRFYLSCIVWGWYKTFVTLHWIRLLIAISNEFTTGNIRRYVLGRHS